MARIFITGSADGLGQLAATSLADQGHQVVIHARNSERARYAKQKVKELEKSGWQLEKVHVEDKGRESYRFNCLAPG